MKPLKTLALLLVLALVLAGAAAAGPSKNKPPKPAKVKAHAQGEVFCPAAPLVVGNVVISAGRCYVVYVLRDARGSFLAFADPAARIPPGQIVRLSTPAGAKLKGRIFYLVPLPPAAVVVPMNSITLVAFRTEDYGPRLTLTLTSTPVPNLSVTFQVRL